MSKNKNTFGGFVFSTNPDFRLEEEPEEQAEEIVPSKHPLRLWKERNKGGKESTIIKGFLGSDEALSDLAKVLKNKCAAGGSSKDGIIIIQGDHRDKILKALMDMGFTNSKKAGG